MKKICLAMLVFAAVAVCRADLLLNTLEPNRQDRFYVGPDKNFLGQPFDWSGVGQTNSGTWATMISPSYFLSAAHYHPATGEVLTFYQGNDPAGPSHQYTVSSWSYQSNYDGVPSDLWLGKLETPIPASDHINYYPVPLLTNLNDYVGQMIYVNGKPNRVGRDIIDRIVAAQEPDPPATPTKNTVSMEFDYNTTSGLGADECYLISGDSGGPSFIDVNGQLALAGIHYYNGGTPGSGYINPISGDSFVPFYLDQIMANLAGESVTTTLLQPALRTWKGGDGSGTTDWAVGANWDPNTTAPDGPGARVSFGTQAATNNIVDMISQGRTVGTMTFSATTSTTIRSTGGFALTLDNSGTSSTIDVAGSHTISALVILNNDLTISGSGTLNLSGGVTGHHSLTITGGILNASSINVSSFSLGYAATAQAIPEPGSLAMLLTIALGGLTLWRRRV